MKAETLVTGLCFGEGPRWHDNTLWLSDMHAHQVITVAADGTVAPVVELPNRPSGLGWLPNNDLLIVSMLDRALMRFDGSALTPYADLSGLASYHCNDMVVDNTGRAYVGHFGFDLDAGATPAPAELICVEPDGSVRIVADDLMFPNGAVISADGGTLIIAETFGARLSAFDIAANGDLSKRRVWAELPDGAVPDGICLDSEGGVWTASPTTNECIRLVEGGNVSHRVTLDQGAFACMLGGASGATLFMLTAASSEHNECRSLKRGKVEYCEAPFPGAGLP